MPALVDLHHIWLHDTADLDDWVRFYSTDRTDNRVIAGGVRAYANGARRTVVTHSRTDIVPVTLRLVPYDDLDRLDAWLGMDLLYRDHVGRMFVGAYFIVNVLDHKAGSHDVSINMTKMYDVE